MSGDSIRKSIRDYENMRESERTYTSEEVALERAALLREAAALCFHNVEARDAYHIQQAILAIPTDQSALERHDAVLTAQTIKVCNEQTLKELQSGICCIPGANEALAKVKDQAQADAIEQCAIRQENEVLKACRAIRCLAICGMSVSPPFAPPSKPGTRPSKRDSTPAEGKESNAVPQIYCVRQFGAPDKCGRTESGRTIAGCASGYQRRCVPPWRLDASSGVSASVWRCCISRTTGSTASAE